MLIAAAMGVAAAVFASQINAEGLWQDEGATAFYTSAPLPQWGGVLLFAEPHNMVYYVLIRTWAFVFGESEVALRGFSVLAAVATVPFIYLIGRRLGGTLPAVATTLLFVLNPFVLNYAVEARTYSLAMLLTTAATWLLLQAAESADRRRWALYAVVMALAVWAHFYAAFVVPAHLIWVLARPRSGWRPALIAIGAVLVASAVMGVAIILWSTERNWISPPSLTSAINRVLPVIGVRRREVLSTALGFAYLAGLLLLGASLLRQRVVSRGVLSQGAASQEQRGRAASDELAAGRALILLWAVVPILFGLVVSLAQPIFISRSLIVVLPALLLGLAAALPLLRHTWLSVAAIALVGAITFSQATLNLHSPKADFRGAFAAIGENAIDGDRVLIYPVRLIWMTAYYYVRRTPDLNGVELLNARNIDRRQAPQLINQVEDDRIWLVIYDGSLERPPGGLQAVLRALDEKGYRVESTAKVRRMQVVLYAPPD